jgi:Beta-propeller repeat
VNPIQPQKGGGDPQFGSDAFVTKINAAGSAIIYSTYLGGSGGDSATAIALDSMGSVYLTGQANSSDFPLLHAVQPTFGGGGDAFVAKINPWK